MSAESSDLFWLVVAVVLFVACAAVVVSHVMKRVDDWSYKRHEDAIVRQAVRELERELEES